MMSDKASMWRLINEVKKNIITPKKAYDFHCECIDELYSENTTLRSRVEELEGRLSGDPQLTATKEQREMWRHSAIAYSNKIEKQLAEAEYRATLLEGIVRELVERGDHLFNALTHNHGDGWLMTDNWQKVVTKAKEVVK
jgi:regulator of replication initiation timing